jgi:hypothetical protein
MIGPSPQMTEAPQLLPIPPEYSSAAKTALVDLEVTLLNAQARVGTIRTLDRKRLWSDWLYRLVKSKAPVATTPVLSSKLLFLSFLFSFCFHSSSLFSFVLSFDTNGCLPFTQG